MQIVKMSERQNMRITTDENSKDNSHDFREQMLLNNSIEGLLSFEIIEIDGKKTYEYKVENMESLEMKCEKEKLKGVKIAAFLDNILTILSRCSEYMLQESDFCLEPDSIYLDKNEKIQLAYFPGFCKNTLEQLNHLSDFLMNRVDYNDDLAVVLIYAFYMKTKETNCTIDELKKLVKEKSMQGEHREYPNIRQNDQLIEINAQNGYIAEKNDFEPYSVRENIVNSVSSIKSDISEWSSSKENIQGVGKTDNNSNILSLAEGYRIATMSQKVLIVAGLVVPILIFIIVWLSGFCLDNRRQTDVVKIAAVALVLVALAYFVEKKIFDLLKAKQAEHLNAGMNEAEEATVLLSMDAAKGEKPMPVTLCSLVSDDSPIINITKFPFFVGADESHMDFALKRTGVSRRHIRIDKSNGVITLSDLNSTNGTILNGKELLPQTPYSLKRGDKIVLGSCSYYLN